MCNILYIYNTYSLSLSLYIYIYMYVCIYIKNRAMIILGMLYKCSLSVKLNFIDSCFNKVRTENETLIHINLLTIKENWPSPESRPWWTSFSCCKNELGP